MSTLSASSVETLVETLGRQLEQPLQLLRERFQISLCFLDSDRAYACLVCLRHPKPALAELASPLLSALKSRVLHAARPSEMQRRDESGPLLRATVIDEPATVIDEPATVIDEPATVI
eukprot:CAMPEP_0119361834 /NCGR_PEP_ID=MMETSP1334-20130426/9059_1 /TAXON_ID=127549 /ORGANISM="Calcidiscus leptoporus, Strain RCC1130" /LENGTH=117 /DNA_ID=CAMNT_0007376945 /DNA_START=427 /DNA_END=776 /DNA_ORIENTATION=+